MNEFLQTPGTRTQAVAMVFDNLGGERAMASGGSRAKGGLQAVRVMERTTPLDRISQRTLDSYTETFADRCAGSDTGHPITHILGLF